MLSPCAGGVSARRGSISFWVWVRPVQGEECKMPSFVQLSVSLKKDACLFGSVEFFPICFADNKTIRPPKNGMVARYIKKMT